MKKISILIIGVLLVSTVFAQPRKGRKPMGKPRVEKRMPNQHSEFGKPENREKMEKMMAYKMTEDLDLSTEQAEIFFPMTKEHREKINKIDSKILEINTEFNKKVKDDKKLTDKQFDDVFDKLHQLEKQKIDEKIKYFKSLKGVIDNKQRAKLMTFKQRFARGVEDRLRIKRDELGRERKRLERKMQKLDEKSEKLNEIEVN